MIAEIMAEHVEPEHAARTLVDKALDHGGKDNVTVLVAAVRGSQPGWSRPSQFWQTPSAAASSDTHDDVSDRSSSDGSPGDHN